MAGAVKLVVIKDPLTVAKFWSRISHKDTLRSVRLGETKYDQGL